MFDYFFCCKDNMPDGLGFSMFGPAHLLWLCAGAAFIILFSRYYAGRPPEARRRIRLRLACFLVFYEILKDVILAVIGYFSVSYLPFHLCGLAIFVILANAIKGDAYTFEIVFALCMPGAAAALTFPDWTAFPLLNFFCIHSFSIHILLMLYPIMIMTAGEQRPNAKRLWACVVFLAVVALPIYFLNLRWNTNFLFINWPSEGSPLVWFAGIFGIPGYLIGYPIMMAVLWTVMYGGGSLLRRLRKKEPAKV